MPGPESLTEISVAPSESVLESTSTTPPRALNFIDALKASMKQVKSPRTPAHDWKQPGQVLADLVKAVEILDTGGIPGPYEAVLPPARYYQYLQAVDDSGYPTARQLRDILAAVHRSPVMREAGAVVSTRGGDLILSVGGDLATGYRLHDRDAVHLFCVETVAPQTVTPEAVCLLDG